MVVLPFGVFILTTTGLGPWFRIAYYLTCFMLVEGSDEVADDYVATETLADGSEAAGETEDVEKNLPPTIDPVAEEPRSWADLSEGSTAPVPSGELELTQVKEEVQEAESLNAVFSAIGVPEVVADEPVVTERDFEQSTLD